MKKLSLSFLSAIMVALVIFTTTGCKKDKDKDDDDTTVKAKPNDQQGSSEADAAISDVNDWISNKKGGGSSNTKVSAYNLPCGVVSVDSTETSPGVYTYKMKYGNNSSCGYNPYKKKSGDVEFKLTNGAAFNSAGAVFTITFIDYTVENTITGNIVVLNGTLTITNQLGGYIWAPILDVQDTVKHKIRGSFTIKYEDGTVRPRTYTQLRTWSSAGGWPGLSLAIAGDSTISGAKYYEFGRTYENDYEYKTEMITNFKWSNCGSTWAGPYVLKEAHAKLHVVNPWTTAYIEVQGGYYYDYSNLTSTPGLVNDCTTNAYKITTVIGGASTTTYQLY